MQLTVERQKYTGEVSQCRFMMMVKHSENQGPPPKGFMDVMAKLGEEAVKAERWS